MVHNRREFWERTFTDAYELAYQTYVIVGLRDAADLAPALGAEDRAAGWRREADRTLRAMLSASGLRPGARRPSDQAAKGNRRRSPTTRTASEASGRTCQCPWNGTTA